MAIFVPVLAVLGAVSAGKFVYDLATGHKTETKKIDNHEWEVKAGLPFHLDDNMPDFNKNEFGNMYMNLNDARSLDQAAEAFMNQGYPIAALLLQRKATKICLTGK